MVSQGIGRKRDTEKVKLLVYAEGQSADALDEDDHDPRDLSSDDGTQVSHVGRKHTAGDAGKKKKTRKVVTF
eukprot:m.13723 g.13723  ORF g.13723 m.13723 type:complete len:72 (-) comp3074_c0_seq1:1685-1900(-)